MKKTIRLVICLMLVLLALTGCGRTAAEQVSGTAGQMEPVLDEITYKLLESPELEYDIPEMLPGIRVPLGGYDAKEEKYAYVYGELLPEEFSLLDKETGAELLAGALTEVQYHEETGEYSAVAEFSQLQVEGDYILRCEYIGYSYPFSIQQELQENNLNEIVENFPEYVKGIEDVQGLEDAALIMLLAYELYGGVFVEEEGEIPQVLNVVTGIVDQLILDREKLEESVVYDDYRLAALLAKYSYVYQVYDKTKASDTVKMANMLWRNAEAVIAEDLLYPVEYRLLAAAELYRATGVYSYRKELETLFSAQIESGQLLVSPYDRMGALTYVSTGQKVKMNICMSLMKSLLAQAEEIAANAERESQILGGVADEKKVDNILWNMTTISIVEYVITNYEYGRVIENQYYYLQGRNPKAYDYVNEMIVENPRWMAIYMLMLSEHLTNDH